MSTKPPSDRQADPEPDVPRRSRTPWLACVLGLSVVVLIASYWLQTRLPDHVVIASGPADGRYNQLARGIAVELRHRLGIRVTVRETSGSLDNLHLLESGEVPLGLYQSETRVILEDSLDSSGETRFVANLYPEFLIPVTPSGSSLDLVRLGTHTVSCNADMSGDHAMLMLLMEHLNQDPSHYRTVPYRDLAAALQNGDVDLAVINCGLGAPVLDHVLKTGEGQLTRIPFLDSFVSKNAALTKSTIPAGYFSMNPVPVPAEDFATVTTEAQLLATSDAPVRLVETTTQIILDPGFQRRMRLTDLNAGGVDYAVARPEFPVHTGAAHIYHPELKPLLNPDFVEGTEGIRSFLVSIVAAIWLARRWWKRRELLSQEHRLDRYIKEVLRIERDQIGIDGDRPDDNDALQVLLDRVTELRQAALSEFTAHELNEDQAVDCFVEMCHALSDKISGKLTRHALRHLVAPALEQRDPSAS